MKTFHVALAAVLLASPAAAQNINLLRGDGTPKTMEQAIKEQEVEDAYKRKLKEIPDQKAASDPWGNVRTPPQKSGTPAKRATTNQMQSR